VLALQVTSPAYSNDALGEIPLLEAVATYRAEETELTIFAVNRRQDGPLALQGDLRAFQTLQVVEHLVLEHADPKAANTADRPDKVTPHAGGDAIVADGVLTTHLPRLSWNVIRLRGPLD